MNAPLEDILFPAIVDNLANGIYVIQENRAIYLNERFGRLLGYPRVAHLHYRDFHNEVLPAGEGLSVIRRVHEQLQAHDAAPVAWGQPFNRVDGSVVWLELEARRIHLAGKPAILGICHDRTDCKLIGEAMHISQETMRLLLDAMEDHVYVVDRQYRVRYANRKMRHDAYGDVATSPCHKVCRDLSEPCSGCSLEEVLAADRPVCREFFDENKGAWYSTIELAVRMPGLNEPAKLGVRRDITARKVAEQRSRALAQRLLHAQEGERKRLSRELHDDLGQCLNAMKIGFDTLAEDLKDRPGDIQNRLWGLSESLNDTIHTIRQLSAGLHPSTLERLGLAETIRYQSAQVAVANGLDIDLKCGTMIGVRLDSDTEINLYRIFQEAMHNIVKHAEAERVQVRLVASHPTVRLQIDDDGKGFTMGKHPDLSGQHLGLISMAERAELLGGSFALKAQPGKGTAISVEVPLNRQQSARPSPGYGKRQPGARLEKENQPCLLNDGS